jgi:aminoglycoside phosphotransferase (APT) family kinase protein
VPSGNEWCWLFVEDAGVEEYSSLIEEHRLLGARWLGMMHATAAHVTVACGLPDRGLSHYLARLQSARAVVRRILADISVDADDRVVLKSIVAQCDWLTGVWGRVERTCESVPRTVVHGDFRGKNMRVRTNHSGTILLPFDWETAGWGLPTIDLAWLADDRATPSMTPAMGAYRSIISESWPELAVHDIGVLAHVGAVCRVLDAVNWACDGLVYEGFDEVMGKTLSQLRFYQEKLVTAVGNLKV